MYLKDIPTVIILTIILCNVTYSQPLAQGKSKFLGAASNQNIWSKFDKYWNQITPGNAGKWGSVEYSQGQYSWTNLDIIYNYAITKNIPFKEHVLIWGQQQPSWISSLDSLNQRRAIEKWIDTVGKRYPLMAQCEVVNEPFNAPPSYKNALGGDGTTGWDWVITAFQLARQSCAPHVKLILNEYNILHDNSRTTNYLTIINLLKERNLIDGIGIQGHYFEFRSDIGKTPTYVWDIAIIKNNLNKLTATGIPVYITEFDIDEPIDSNQVNQYKIYFPIFWSNPGVKGITLWGYHYYDVWNAHPNTYLIDDRGGERPALQWLRTYILTPLVPVLVSPVNVVSGLPRNPKLIWRSSESATSYRVQVASQSSYPLISIIVDTTLTDTTLQLQPLNANTTYYWRVNASNEHGTSEFSGSNVGFRTGDKILNVIEKVDVPIEFSLYQNYPNPFNPITTISYQLMTNSYVSLKIIDLLGQEITTLVDEMKHAGTYKIHWDATNYPSGVYFVKMTTERFSKTKKLVLQK